VETISAKAWPETEPKDRLSDRELVDRHVTHIIVRTNSIDINLKDSTPGPAPSLATEAPVTVGAVESACPTVISLPWSTPAFASVKGIVHQPEAKPSLKQETRDAILAAVAKARSWIEGIASGRVQSFAEIAEREGKVVRHIRLLTPLAFIPPRTLAAIIDGTVRHEATVTALARAMPYRWDRSPAG
jgi:site-specific DNA recombinase